MTAFSDDDNVGQKKKNGEKKQNTKDHGSGEGFRTVLEKRYRHISCPSAVYRRNKKVNPQRTSQTWQ